MSKPTSFLRLQDESSPVVFVEMDASLQDKWNQTWGKEEEDAFAAQTSLEVTVGSANTIAETPFHSPLEHSSK
jgi:hypothetical protein